MQLGNRQLALLRTVGTTDALVGATKRSRRLSARGLMREARPGGLVHITPEGLRALADAADAGRISLDPTPEKRGV
ncbi:MAG: hypothetical protein JJ902_23445 [Roseibium sp.]|nr:hypothetical protein [Roseibium sp.]